ncbi:Small nuclear RNA activating complex (SNAPc) subunit SNAP43 protein [Citrus sinensis]|uniref:Small nuclear RNA activating complex (SNAPc) subunit SNAP43 protein n=1 Tax=Citrus sinensis TaxID=2711 RepID=A0ACB8L1R5_CITSI|nr:Small nuclear RNA activating complex (SNAPc) subunit SNAP43 protein [Citrus sinensis]
MDLSPFKQDIDELIDEFAQDELRTLADMKRVWLSRKFTYIYEASPSTNLSFFMQSLPNLFSSYAGHMVSNDSLSRRLGELKKLKELVVEAKNKDIRVVPALVKRMLEKKIFLFGFVDLNESSITETVNQLTDLQNARVQVAYEKLFASTRIEHFIHMDLGMEVDLNVLLKMSTEYAEAKKQAIQEASEVVDVQNVKHIVDDQELMGDVVEKITENWNVQRELFYQQTRMDQQPPAAEQRQLQVKDDEQGGDEEFGQELEQLLFQA